MGLYKYSSYVFSFEEGNCVEFPSIIFGQPEFQKVALPGVGTSSPVIITESYIALIFAKNYPSYLDKPPTGIKVGPIM